MSDEIKELRSTMSELNNKINPTVDTLVQSIIQLTKINNTLFKYIELNEQRSWQLRNDTNELSNRADDMFDTIDTFRGDIIRMENNVCDLERELGDVRETTSHAENEVSSLESQICSLESRIDC